MFTVNEIRKEMARLDQISGLDTSTIPVRVSSRMSTSWGHCTATRPRNGKYTIKELAFSDQLLKYATPEHVLDTVRHEYAHAYVFLSIRRMMGMVPYGKALRLSLAPRRKDAMTSRRSMTICPVLKIDISMN